MLRESVIAEVAAKQKTNVLGRSPGMPRLERLGNVPPGFASIVTGVRRCGKSTLMEQRMRSAMRSLGRKRGWIVTIADEDELSLDEGTVRIVPFHKFKPEETLTK